MVPSSAPSLAQDPGNSAWVGTPLCSEPGNLLGVGWHHLSLSLSCRCWEVFAPTTPDIHIPKQPSAGDSPLCPSPSGPNSLGQLKLPHLPEREWDSGLNAGVTLRNKNLAPRAYKSWEWQLGEGSSQGMLSEEQRVASVPWSKCSWRLCLVNAMERYTL